MSDYICEKHQIRWLGFTRCWQCKDDEVTPSKPDEPRRQARIICGGTNCGEWNCDDCHPETKLSNPVGEAKNEHRFIGKPLDSECFYGYHDQCHGCNCICHKANGNFVEATEPNPAPQPEPDDKVRVTAAYFDFLQSSLDKAMNQLDAKDAVIAELQKQRDHLLQQAQIQAQEMRTHKSTVHEIYQVLTGATGEPGNWNGAEPARRVMQQLSALREDKDAAWNEAIEACGKYLEDDGRYLNGTTSMLTRTKQYDVARDNEQKADRAFRYADKIRALKRPLPGGSK